MRIWNCELRIANCEFLGGYCASTALKLGCMSDPPAGPVVTVTHLSDLYESMTTQQHCLKIRNSKFAIPNSQFQIRNSKFLLFLFQHSLRLWLLLVQITLDRVQDSIDELSGFV